MPAAEPAEAASPAPAETSSATDGVNEIDGVPKADVLEVADQPASAQQPSSAAHASTPISLIAPRAEPPHSDADASGSSRDSRHVGQRCPGRNTRLGHHPGGAGNDIILGSEGADVIDGGIGNDTVSYETSSEAVHVDLANEGPQSGGDAEGDVLVSIENVTVSAYDDTLSGNSASNVLEGGKGADHIDGGAGIDTASYASSSEAVSVDLADAGPHSGGDASATCSFHRKT